jgi:hypothetical protein
MNTYSTEFPIKDGYSIDDVLSLAFEWVSESPHSIISADDISVLRKSGNECLTFQNEELSFGRVMLSDYDIGGLKWVIRGEDGLEWVSTLVTLKKPEEHVVNIQVTCKAINTSMYLPFPKKPYIIKKLIKSIGGGQDGLISVLDKPHYFSEFDVSYAADIINGNSVNLLPVVYVSVGFDGGYILDPMLLAYLLSGVAHIFVEPDRSFSYSLKGMTDSKNTYGGAIGVYWPDQNTRKTYFIKDNITTKDLMSLIVKEINYAVSNRRSITGCDWYYLWESIAKYKYEELQKKGSTALDDYITAFDEEKDSLRRRLEEEQLEVSRLRRMLSDYNKNADEVRNAILFSGKEQDYYESEIRDIIIVVLEESLRNIQRNSRREHLVKDIVSHNKSTKNGLDKADEIKKLFKSGIAMDTRVKNKLYELGFYISEDGKHYKLIFQGDGRYTFSVSKSSSDHRAGKNLYCEINKKLF